ncbi:L-threonylcarbamoyladenylate synthase [Candidiatus Paracoxiella cheracis]|uniref:L-threonylcarbamoyladenylate synthase n=1 Tax=Candidiatus Paracoxiella cheracis TaxID=3405120 RepID=UPI003BF4B59D
MTTILAIHPQNPQARLVEQVVERIRRGGVIVYPTDSDYALGCQIGNKNAVETIRRIRQLDKRHKFTLLCRDLSEIAVYAHVDNPVFRFLKAHTPGPYTFILPATKEVPRRLVHPKRKTIGIRIPQHEIVMAILKELEEPLMNVTLQLPDQDYPMTDIAEIEDQLSGRVDLIIDGGPCGVEPTTIVDLTSGVPEVLREGKGDTRDF